MHCAQRNDALNEQNTTKQAVGGNSSFAQTRHKELATAGKLFVSDLSQIWTEVSPSSRIRQV